MNCVIIEDGIRAQKHLENQLALSGYEINVVKKIDSVEMAVSWLKNNRADIIFLDVQLGDGLSFEIFDHVEVDTPIVFTTSYDQYMQRAFEQNSISYLLKPIELESLKAALKKYERFHHEEPQRIGQKITAFRQDYQKRLLVQKGNVIKSITVEEISYLHVQSKGTVIAVTQNNEQYLYENTLERLEQRLDPDKFFRINRQFIVNIDSIIEMKPYDEIRLKVETMPPCKEEMLVSFKRVRHFREWLNR